ncbi:MAG TPA: DUF1707 domain-containing protein [Amycolatopsis sp.]|nr:DUF1707 domain-containing protein [Amycolatopsis sp.]
MRLSDAERDEALEVLSEHVRTGRLDVDEYGTRSARVTTAKTTSDLVPLFEDLPEPHPRVLKNASRPTQRPPSPAPARRLTGLVPIAAIVALLLFLTVVHTWLVFVLPAVVALALGARSR